MVWIYGGGNSFGQIYDLAYDRTALVTGAAQKGFPVIYVAMNYRVGIFGFAASPALNTTDCLNVGLLV
jgi:carboxylesterase type B